MTAGNIRRIDAISALSVSNASDCRQETLTCSGSASQMKPRMPSLRPKMIRFRLRNEQNACRKVVGLRPF